MKRKTEWLLRLEEHSLRSVLYKEKELRIEEAPIPEIGDDEVLVKNKVSTTPAEQM